jgi:CheY-like chemotaxis protein
MMRWRACRAAPERFDAIVVGRVPAAGTLALAAALNRLAPDLPIVLATATVEAFDTPSPTQSGVTALVRYPLSSAELAGALARCLAVPPRTPSRSVDRAASVRG